MKKVHFFATVLISINSLAQVGINTTTPTSMLDVNGQVTIDQKNFGGYGGLLIKGDAPGNNYPNITFSILNNSGNDIIAGYIGGNINNNTTGNEAMDLSFLTSTNGLGGLSEKMRIKDTGNIGIGTINPSQKLDVQGGNARINNTFIGDLGHGSAWSGYAHQSQANTTGYGFLQSSDGNFTLINKENTGSGYIGFRIANSDVAIINNAGNMGVGTVTPSQKLDIAGKIKITDGSQAAGRVLTSDATGVGTWQTIGINNISATLGSGVNVPFSTSNYLQTGTSITLPSGRYAVNVTMLLSQPGNALTPANSSFWLRSTFSDSSAVNPTASGDIQGSSLVSGNLTGSSFFSLMNGTIIINNTDPSSKTYYYVAGTTSVFNTTGTVTLIGGNLAENNIIAYKLQ